MAFAGIVRFIPVRIETPEQYKRAELWTKDNPYDFLVTSKKTDAPAQWQIQYDDSRLLERGHFQGDLVMAVGKWVYGRNFGLRYLVRYCGDEKGGDYDEIEVVQRFIDGA